MHSPNAAGQLGHAFTNTSERVTPVFMFGAEGRSFAFDGFTPIAHAVNADPPTTRKSNKPFHKLCPGQAGAGETIIGSVIADSRYGVQAPAPPIAVGLIGAGWGVPRWMPSPPRADTKPKHQPDQKPRYTTGHVRLRRAPILPILSSLNFHPTTIKAVGKPWIRFCVNISSH